MFCKTRMRFFLVTDREVPSAIEGSEDPCERATEVLVWISHSQGTVTTFKSTDCKYGFQ